MTSTMPPATPEREGRHTLIYEGATIRQRGLMLNLTDMWRAAGSPEHRRPSDWLALADTQRFRRYARARWPSTAPLMPPANAGIPGIRTAEPDGLVAALRGGAGGTWAHWQLALSYARYLSPAFHAWCNGVVRGTMERFGPPRGKQGGALARRLEWEFGRLHRRLDTVDRHAADLMFLMASAQELLLDKRRPFSALSRAIIGAVLAAAPYEGQCPCCGEVPVLGTTGEPVQGAEFDHFFHRGLNRPEHGWLICRDCHAELTAGGYLCRFSRVAEFRRFQSAVHEHRRQRLASLRVQPRRRPEPPST